MQPLSPAVSHGKELYNTNSPNVSLKAVSRNCLRTCACVVYTNRGYYSRVASIRRNTVIYIIVAHLNSFCLFTAGEMLPARLYHQGHVSQDTQSRVQTHGTEVSICHSHWNSSTPPSCSLIPRPHPSQSGNGIRSLLSIFASLLI